jgi:hypothetical protein
LHLGLLGSTIFLALADIVRSQGNRKSSNYPKGQKIIRGIILFMVLLILPLIGVIIGPKLIIGAFTIFIIFLFYVYGIWELWSYQAVDIRCWPTLISAPLTPRWSPSSSGGPRELEFATTLVFCLALLTIIFWYLDTYKTLQVGFMIQPTEYFSENILWISMYMFGLMGVLSIYYKMFYVYKLQRTIELIDKLIINLNIDSCTKSDFVLIATRNEAIKQFLLSEMKKALYRFCGCCPIAWANIITLFCTATGSLITYVVSIVKQHQ